MTGSERSSSTCHGPHCEVRALCHQVPLNYCTTYLLGSRLKPILTQGDEWHTLLVKSSHEAQSLELKPTLVLMDSIKYSLALPWLQPPKGQGQGQKRCNILCTVTLTLHEVDQIRFCAAQRADLGTAGLMTATGRIKVDMAKVIHEWQTSLQ